MPEIAAKPMASTRHLMEGFIPPITGGDVGPRNRQRGILPLVNFLVERDPRNQIRRKIGIPIGRRRCPACAIVESRLGLGDITQPVVREPFP
jgi:hypothetical protein